MRAPALMRWINVLVAFAAWMWAPTILVSKTNVTEPPVPAPGSLVDLGGWRLHINCAGDTNPSRRAVRPLMAARECALLILLAWATVPLAAQSSASSAPLVITRASGPIVIDGDLSDEGWHGVTPVTRWYETQPADNTEPKVRNVGYLAYDDRFFYAAFEFDDPDPSAMRAPYADRDNIGNGQNDYGGILLDTRNTGSTGVFFVVTPRNVQYDSITDDASGENSSPDFFWDSATRITPHGWTLEMRVPFSSLRYRHLDPQTWRIFLYRNYPRDRHYQFFSARIPRDSNCFVCNANLLEGLEGLPRGGHLVAAPYVSGTSLAQPSGVLGTPLVGGALDAHAGLDVKYLPNADNAIDLTVSPDFSQVESDTAQIATNQRFALFYPEKRPFFLEGVDLLATPIQAVYTRTITAPDAGGRVTGKAAGLRYTVLVVNDTGGGSAVLPGPVNSTFASVDFGSTVMVARVKRDLGLSFLSVLATDRENHAGNGHNRVAGPDLQWRPSSHDVVSGQWLFSDTRTPNRSDLASAWTGVVVGGDAATAQWNHNTTHLDWYGMYKDITDGFRADTGFVPQVGYREVTGQTGWTVRPRGFLSRLRTFFNVDRQVDRAGALVSRDLQPGAAMDTALNGFMQFRYIRDDIRTPGGVLIPRQQFAYMLQFGPSHAVPQIGVNGMLGQDIDFDNSRPGRGPTMNFFATLDPTQHFELASNESLQWLNITDTAGLSRRLFTAQVSRLRAQYMFTSRMFVRLIGQYISTDRDPTMYVLPVSRKDGSFSGSLLFEYKINWQSVMFVGYGDDRTLDSEQRLQRADRQVFVKVSYAFQR
jgi:hypothetical protein